MTNYETRLVTLPIVTGRTQPDSARVGPWRIKRSQSVNDATSSSLCNIQEGTPTLKQFLSKLDEQCREINDLASYDLEKQEPTSSSSRRPSTPDISPLDQTLPSYQELRKAHASKYWRPRIGDFLIVTVMLGSAMFFVAPSAISYFLSDYQTTRAIVTLQEMRRTHWFPAIICITAMIAGFNSALAVGALHMVGQGMAMTRSRFFKLVGAALIYGGILTVWLLMVISLLTQAL